MNSERLRGPDQPQGNKLITKSSTDLTESTEELFDDTSHCSPIIMSHLLGKDSAKSKTVRSPPRAALDELGALITSTPMKTTNTYEFDDQASFEAPPKKLKLTERTKMVNKPSPTIAHQPATSSQQLAARNWQPAVRSQRSSDHERIKSLETKLVSLTGIVGALQVEVRRLAGKSAPSQPDRDGLVALHGKSKTKMEHVELCRIRDSSKTASIFVVSMLPYIFSYNEIYRRSLRKSEKSGVSKLALDKSKLEDLLRCAEAHKPDYNEIKVRSNLSNHLKNLNNLAGDIKDGADLNDALCKAHKLTRDHLKFTGFSAAVRSKFADLDEEIAQSCSESANWFAEGLLNQHATFRKELNEGESDLCHSNSLNNNTLSPQLPGYQDDLSDLDAPEANENANENGDSEENAIVPNLENESKIDESSDQTMITNHEEIDVSFNLHDESAIQSDSQMNIEDSNSEI